MNYLGSFLEWFSRTFDVEFDEPFAVYTQNVLFDYYILTKDGIYNVESGGKITNYVMGRILEGEMEVKSNWKPKQGEKVILANRIAGAIILNTGYFDYNDLNCLLKLSCQLVYKNTDNLKALENYRKSAEEIYKTLQRDLKGE